MGIVTVAGYDLFDGTGLGQGDFDQAILGVVAVGASDAGFKLLRQVARVVVLVACGPGAADIGVGNAVTQRVGV